MFNVQPEMNALEIPEKARGAILSHKYDQLQVRVNLPKGDIAAHTGDKDATIVGCRAADEAVKDESRMLEGIYIGVKKKFSYSGRFVLSPQGADN